MAIGPIQFQAASDSSNRPFTTGLMNSQSLLQALLNNYTNAIQAKNLPDQLAAALQNQQLKNQEQQINLDTLPQMNQALLAYKQAQTPNLQANTNFTNLQSKYYPQDILSQIANRQANTGALNQRTEQARNNPLLGETGVAGQLGALLFLQQHPELNGGQAGQQQQPQQMQQQQPQFIPGISALQQQQQQPMQQAQQPLAQALNGQQSVPQQLQTNGNQLSDILRSSLINDQSKKQALTDYFNTRTQGYSWSQLPATYKSLELAQARAMGYTPTEASSRFLKGDTIDQLAKDKGYSPDNLPLPDFAPTNAILTNTQRANVALSALDKIDPIITDAVAPYSRRFEGYSPAQIVDALKGTDVDKQARYLAAAALQPEMAALRIKAAQGQVGQHAISDMIDAAQNRIRVVGGSVDPKVYSKMNKYITTWLSQMNGAENRALTRYQSDIDKQQDQRGSSGSNVSGLSDDQLLALWGGDNG